MFPTPFTGEEEAEGLRDCTTTKTKPAWTHHTQNLSPLRDPSKVNCCREVWVIHILGSVSQNELCTPRFSFQSKSSSKETFRICLRQLRDSPSNCGGLRQEPQMPISNMPHMFVLWPHLPGLCYPLPMSLARAGRRPSLEVLFHFLWLPEALIPPLSLSAGV